MTHSKFGALKGAAIVAAAGVLIAIGAGANQDNPIRGRESPKAGDDARRLALLEHEFSEFLKRYIRLAEDLKQLAHTAPPIGSVTMWWGDKSKIPDGWELCDGKEAAAPGAVFRGTKPDLIDRFPKGATGDRQTATELVSEGMAGSNNMPSLVLRNFENLQVTGGEHPHLVRVRTGHDAGSGTPDRIVARGEDRHVHETAQNGWADPGGSGHGHNFSGFIGKAGGVTADGSDATGANQPAYSEIFFIIRVK